MALFNAVVGTLRDYVINGESLVLVKGGSHLLATDAVSPGVAPLALLTELGLGSQEIRVTPRFFHQDMIVDDFGPDVPADVQWKIADITLRIPLVHVDKKALGICFRESMGGSLFEGTCAPAGTPLGGGWPMFSSGNHLISLNIASPQLQYPWRFRSCYMTDQPYEWPVGVGASIIMTNWRCIPYQPLLTSGLGGASGNLPGFVEILSSGAVLFDRTLDT